MLLYTSNDDEMMKNLNWFCENQVPFKENYWTTLHSTLIELNTNTNTNWINSSLI